MRRPSTIPGIEKVAEVDAVLQAVLPWHVSNGDFLRRQPEGAAERFRKRGEEALVKVLEHVGY
jgi:hypothetical protein